MNAPTGRPELVERLRSEIGRHGPLTFDRFMDMALYEPGLGYYAARGDSAMGQTDTWLDFQTSPQVHSIFGTLIARQLEILWIALNCPEPFVVVELGAGDGELASQIVRALADLHPDLCLVYHAVDRRPRSTWQAAPDAIPGSIQRWDDLEQISRTNLSAHCVLSNEFFDALPVHRVTWLDGKLWEVYVDWSNHGFVEHLAPPSNEKLIDWLAAAEASLTEGWTGEICLRLPGIIEHIARLINRGVVLTIDYGGEAEELHDLSRNGGTLIAYHRHHWNDDVLTRIGEQDLTSHVDFSALMRLGLCHGLTPAGFTTQRDFLLALDLPSVAQRMLAEELTAAKRWQSHFAINELLRQDGLGRLKVLAQQKGLPTFWLSGARRQ